MATGVIILAVTEALNCLGMMDVKDAVLLVGAALFSAIVGGYR